MPTVAPVEKPVAGRVRSGPGNRWPSRLRGPLTAAAFTAAAVGYVAAVDPSRSGSHYPLCPFRALTGFWCPGCGGLRAVHELAHGRLAAALSSDLVVVAGLVPAAIWIAWVRAAAVGRPFAVRFTWAPAGALIGALLVFGVLRNLPGLHFLAP
jgi:hypothetical protein